MNKGQELVLKVLIVIPSKEFIFLSKIKVTPEEIIKHRKIYKRLYLVDRIMRLLSVRTNKSIQSLYAKIVWNLYRMKNDPLQIFQNISLGDEKIFKELKLQEKIKNELINIIKIRIPPKLLEIRCIIELACYSFEGIDDIKEALLNGKKFENDNVSIIYRSLGAPNYECILYTYNKDEGINIMDESLNEVKNIIENKSGTYLLKKGPLVAFPKKKEFLY